MGNAIATSASGETPFEKTLKDFRSKSADDLLRIVEDELNNGIMSFIRMGVALRVMEEMGLDLKERFRGPIFPIIRKIGWGQIAPELAYAFQGNFNFIADAAGLPLSEQKRLALPDPLRVAVLNDGKPDFILRQPLAMSPKERKQVIAKDHLRSDEEQVAILQSSQPAPKPIATFPVQFNHKKRTVTINGYEITLKQLEGILESLKRKGG